MKIAIVYYSRGGITKQMGELIRQELCSQHIDTKFFFSEDITAKDLLEYDGIIIGSPTYYGTMATEIKQLLDDSVSYHGKLEGKVGAAFSSSANVAGGNETTIISILEAMLIHGMIIQGDPKGDHYGPVAVGSIDSRCKENCKRFAARFAALLEKVRG